MIGFIINQYSDFQYIIPLNLFLKEQGLETIFFSDNNFALIKSQKLSDIAKYKLSFVFSVDSLCDLKIDLSKRKFKHILIQNYHDIFTSFKSKTKSQFYKNCDYFWLENNKYKKELKNNSNSNTISQILPNYWRYFKFPKSKILEKYTQYVLDKTKVAICYMPRNKMPDNVLPVSNQTSISFINHAINFGKFLEDNGFVVLFKQKPQFRYEIGNDNLIVSDTLYPNESMDLGYISNFGFGYMSCAIMHHRNFSIKYINFIDNRYSQETKNLLKNSYVKNLIEERTISDDEFEKSLKFIKSKETVNKIEIDDLITKSKEKILKVLK